MPVEPKPISSTLSSTDASHKPLSSSDRLSSSKIQIGSSSVDAPLRQLGFTTPNRVVNKTKAA
jgi:hypothetical protein